MHLPVFGPTQDQNDTTGVEPKGESTDECENTDGREHSWVQLGTTGERIDGREDWRDGKLPPETGSHE